MTKYGQAGGRGRATQRLSHARTHAHLGRDCGFEGRESVLLVCEHLGEGVGLHAHRVREEEVGELVPNPLKLALVDREVARDSAAVAEVV